MRDYLIGAEHHDGRTLAPILIADAPTWLIRDFLYSGMIVSEKGLNSPPVPLEALRERLELELHIRALGYR